MHTDLQNVHAGTRGARTKVIDLTHTIDEGSPYWPEKTPGTPFRVSVTANYEADGFYDRQLVIPEHFGTHLDAPAHLNPKGKTIDQLPAETFLSAAVVIDVSAAAKSQPDYRLSTAEVESWVRRHGPIPQGSLVLVRTGWDERWPSQAEYVNADARGVMHFPGLSTDAARFLLQHARPVGIGIDTSSIDYGPSEDFPVHRMTLSAGLYHLENVANLGQLPARNFTVIALPLKLRNGSGSPARVLALLGTEASSLS